MAEAARHAARILPVDSEHSAIFQALVGEDIGSVERIILTASGGALRDWPLERLAKAHGGPKRWRIRTGRWAADHHRFGQHVQQGAGSHRDAGVLRVDPDQIEVIIHPKA